jgi:prepilin-type N-terminal cleavage/methylation domain-containing protein
MKTLNQMKTQKQSQSGFTLIEVLVALVVLSFGVLGLITTTHSVNLHQRKADDATEATMVATDYMENIKRLATNEPLGGIFGFDYIINDQTGGFLASYSTPNDFMRSLAETNSDDTDIPAGFTRTTTFTVFPPPAWATEDFTAPGTIHMVEIQVDVAWTDPTGIAKNIALNTVLQRRQFIQ